MSAAETQHSDGNRVSERQKRNRIHKELSGREPKGFTNKNFWTRGYCVSTVGLDEKQIREYIQNQERLEAGEQYYLNFQPPLKGLP
jgi:REP element-mobilizing transposase RayT